MALQTVDEELAQLNSQGRPPVNEGSQFKSVDDELMALNSGGGYSVPTVGEPSYWDAIKYYGKQGIRGALRTWEIPARALYPESEYGKIHPMSEYFKPTEAEERKAQEFTIPQQVIGGAAGLPGAAAKYLPMIALGGGIGGSAIAGLAGYAEEIQEGKSHEEALKRGLTEAATMGVFGALGRPALTVAQRLAGQIPLAPAEKLIGKQMGRLGRAGIGAATFGAPPLLETGEPRQAIAPAITGATLFGLTGKTRYPVPRPGMEEPQITEIPPTLPPPGPPPLPGLPTRAEKQFRRFGGWGQPPSPYEGMESFGELGRGPTPQELWGVPPVGGLAGKKQPGGPGGIFNVEPTMADLTEPLGKARVAPEPKPTVPPKFVQKRIRAFDVPYLGELRELQGLVKRGEPGGKTFTSTPTENLIVGGYGSSYPNFMKNMGWTKDEVLRTLDKGMKGKKLGVREKVIWDTANGEAEAIYKARVEEQRVFEERKAIADEDPEFIREDTITTLTKNFDDEIMGLREQLNEEGISNTKIGSIIEEAEKSYQSEGRPPSPDRIKEILAEPTEPAPEVVSLREIFKSGRKEITEPELQNLPDVKSGARTPEDMRVYLESKGIGVKATSTSRPLIESAMKAKYASGVDITDDWKTMTPQERQQAVADGLHIETDRSGLRVIGSRSMESRTEELRKTVMEKAKLRSAPSPTRVGEQLLPGMKVGLEMKGAKQGVAPTLEGTPLAEAARKAELERVQPGLGIGNIEPVASVESNWVQIDKGVYELLDSSGKRTSPNVIIRRGRVFEVSEYDPSKGGHKPLGTAKTLPEAKDLAEGKVVPQLRLAEETPTTALPNETLQPLINKRTTELKNAPPVMTAETSMEFPERIRTKDVAGAYDPETGTVWMARDKMASSDYALKTLNEEITHHAVDQYLKSKNADRFIDLTFRKYGNTLEKELTDLGYTFDFNTPEGRRQATLEKLGKLGETGEEAGLLKRMYAAIRSFIRDRFGIGQELTDAEIQTFITRSISDMRKGKYGGMEGMEAREAQVQGAPPQYRRQQELLPDEKRVQEHIVSEVADTRTIGEKVKDASNNLYYYAVNKWWPVEKVAPQEAAKIRLAGPKGYGQATTMLERGIPDPKQAITEGQPIKWIGEGLEPILKPLVDAKELGSFVRYGFSKRAIEKLGQDIEIGGKATLQDYKDIVARYENQTIAGQTYKQYFDRLQTFQDNILQYYRDSGMLSMDAYNQIKAKNLMYFPFYRALEERGPDGIGSAIQPRSVIRKMRGGPEKILDPIDSIVKNTYNLVMNAEKNMALSEFIKSGVAKEILPGMPGYGGHRHAVSLYEMKNSGFFQDMLEDANLGKTDAQGKFRLNTGVKKQLEDEIVNIFRPNFIKGKENMFVVYEKGQPRIFEIDPQLGRALHGMDKEATNIIVKIMNYPTQWLRAGAILSPEFMARNPLRDWFSAFIYAKHGFNPFNFFEGLADAGGKSDLYYKWLSGGGSQSSFVGMDRTDLRQTAKQILDKKRLMGLLTGNDYKEITQHLITHPVQGLRTLSELSEIGTRLAVYKRALAKGMTQEEAILQSRESTIDFARIGAKSKALNMIIAFWNANVQGLDKLTRQLNFINKENRPVALRTFARATATITIPSLLLAWANEDDPRVQELPEWQKTLFWIIPTENHIWRIPKPFELGIIFGTVPELIMRWMKTDDPKTLEKIGSALTTGSLPGVIPTAVLPFVENWWNKSAFTGRPIVPRGKEELQPQYQFQPYTTEMAKTAGNVMSKLPYIGETGIASPAKIENLVRGWTGGLGMHLMRLAGRGMKEAGVTEERVEPSKTLSDIPFIKAFVSRYPGADSQSLHDFYDTYNKVNSLRTTTRTLREEGKMEEATNLIREHKDTPIQAYHGLNRVHRSLSKMREAINRIYQNQSMNPEEKRQMIDQITLQMIAVAKGTNERLGIAK